MIRLATPADLSQAADIYEEILDREAQGPVYTNWQRGKYPTIDTARQALEATGIALYPGVSGEADRAVAALLAGELAYDAGAVCDHHEHDHGQDCASHDCAQDHQGCPGNHPQG